MTVRLSARDLVHKAFKTTTSRGMVAPFCCMLDGTHRCGVLCDTLTAAIETRDREAEAREAGLKAEVDLFHQAVMLKPGDVVDGIGELTKKGVENGHYVWWVAGTGGVCSLNNLIGHMREARALATTPRSGTAAAATKEGG